MPKPLGMLIEGFDYSNAADDEFNDWCDTEYLPLRMRTRGVISAQRWLGVGEPKISFLTADLESAGVLQQSAQATGHSESRTPWSVRIGRKVAIICRLVAEQITPGNRAGPEQAGGLLVYAMNVKQEAEAEFNDWYDQEHLPALAAVPGCLCARRFKAEGGIHRYIALYHLSGTEVTTTQAWRDTRRTPWTRRVGPSTSDHMRFLLRRTVRGS